MKWDTYDTYVEGVRTWMWSRDHVAGWAEVDFKITKIFQLNISHTWNLDKAGWVGTGGRERKRMEGP